MNYDFGVIVGYFSETCSHDLAPITLVRCNCQFVEEPVDLDPISQFEGEDGFSSNKYRKGGVVTASNPEFESALFGYFTYIGKLAHATRYIENQCIAGFHFVGKSLLFRWEAEAAKALSSIRFPIFNAFNEQPIRHDCYSLPYLIGDAIDTFCG